MVWYEIMFRVEEHLHSVKDIKKLILSVEDAEEWATINKVLHVLHVLTQLLDSENVQFILMQDGWSKKVQQRKGTGTGRMRYLKTIPRVYKNQIKGLAKWLWWSLFKLNYTLINGLKHYYLEFTCYQLLLVLNFQQNIFYLV